VSVKFVDEAPTPFQRASHWVHFNLYEIEEVRQGRDRSYSAREDGCIMESTDFEYECVGTWKLEGNNIVIEIESY